MEGERKERERNIDGLLLRDLAHRPGMCPDWESNRRLFGLWDNVQPTELHWPGLCLPYSWFLTPFYFACTVSCLIHEQVCLPSLWLGFLSTCNSSIDYFNNAFLFELALEPSHQRVMHWSVRQLVCVWNYCINNWDYIYKYLRKINKTCIYFGCLQEDLEVNRACEFVCEEPFQEQRKIFRHIMFLKHW